VQIDSKEALDYFLGKRFSNGWTFNIPPQRRITPRNQRLVELAQGKTVIHLGCADHVELIEQKMRQGQYLHALLRTKTKKLIGVDINQTGIQAMQALGFTDIYLPSQVPAGHYDLLIVSDVIEHIPNVESFLQELKVHYSFNHIIITTPNAYRRLNRRQYKGELINTDHRYWFSPFTLAKAVISAGYHINTIEFTDNPSLFNIYRNITLKKHPLQQDGLLVIAQGNS
jgi:2-polyprenyl-3-methyl-5-hydroxy-6-metoxy-1,4-benzoquinol methylase